MPDAPEPPVRDPLVAAALHDLKGALAAQALLVSSLERDVRSPARLDHMAGTIGSLRETVEHASELARLLTLASLPPASTMAVGMAELVRLALAVISSDVHARFTLDLGATADLGAVREPGTL